MTVQLLEKSIRILPTFPVALKGFLAYKTFVSDKCLLLRYLFADVSPRLCAHGDDSSEHESGAYGGKKIKFFYQFSDRHNNVLGSIPQESQKRIETEQEYLEDTTNSFGITLNKKSEFVHLAGMLRNLVSGGKLVVAVPPQVIYKQRSEGQFRKC